MVTSPIAHEPTRVAGIIRSYDRWIGRVAWILSLGAAATTLTIAGLLVSDLVAREVVGEPLSAVFETVRTSMVAVVFLGLAYAEHTGAHIRVEALTENLKGRTLAAVRSVGLTVGLVVAVMFTVMTFERAVVSTRVNEIVLGLVNFPIWPSRWLIVIGFTAMTLVFIGKVAAALHALVVGEELSKPSIPLEDAI